ncbi:hypothetical protein GKZ89_06240 [Bacillus mangrovi]|uniref:Uncharacterized protein n=1 Tax=Metabacillus mangrovi TaxID=1491830 RepID=A0A7X2S4B8_9BACI|nr:hypothetical protein [Metabacillus mangrovi]MTH53005.1 hypothetical protein [Metabacillus mangrovi]
MRSYERNLELAGAFIQLGGTAIAAAGETITAAGESEGTAGQGLIGAGNGTEAAGNALQAIALSENGTRVFSALGSWLQAAGNSTNAFASFVLLKGSREAGLRLDILGDSIQAVGAAIEAAAVDPSLFYADEIITGEYLVSFGAGVEAIGSWYLLQGKEQAGNSINAFGSYLQFTGVALISGALTKDYIREDVP